MGAKRRATGEAASGGAGRPITERVRRREGHVSGAMLAGFRAALLTSDRWPEIGGAFQLRTGHATEWLDARLREPWVPFAWYPALLDAICQVLGEDELRQIVRKQIVAPDRGGLYGSVLRSWARSFGASPDTMLPAVEHLWRAATRGAGTVSVAIDSVERCAVVRCDGEAARALDTSAGFRCALGGLALGLIDQARPRPTLVEVDPEGDDGLEVRWSPT